MRVAEKEEKGDKVVEESARGRESPIEKPKVSPYLQPSEEKTKGVEIKPRSQEDRKPLPRRRDEDKDNSKRSRTPKRRREKEKRRRSRRRSASTEVSGSEVRRQKREPQVPQEGEKENTEQASPKKTDIEKNHI